MRWIILKTGSTLEPIAKRRGDFEDWIVAGMGVPSAEVDVIPMVDGVDPPALEEVRGVVVTGSPAMVTAREPWSVRSGAWLRHAVERDVPVLGICYGHQLLADALGGRVAPNPKGREIGTVVIHRTEAAASDPLLGDLPDTFLAHESHSEVVVQLPEGAVLLAENETSAHQAFRARNAWGLQFHPEFDADIVRGYIRERYEAIRSEGLDPDGLLARTKDSDSGSRILEKFAEFAAGPLGLPWPR